MLVLSRRESEEILIPELGITLQVVRIQGTSVRIGIDAPREIRVIRGEMREQSVASKAGLAEAKSVAYCPSGRDQHSSQNAVQKELKSSVRESVANYTYRRDFIDSVVEADKRIAC